MGQYIVYQDVLEETDIERRLFLAVLEFAQAGILSEPIGELLVRKHGSHVVVYYYPVIHIDVRDDKFWIQHDSIEGGMALDLIAAGIPKEQIVLAFYPLEARLHSEFAAA